MKFYHVKPQYSLIYPNNDRYEKNARCLFGNELMTKREWKNAFPGIDPLQYAEIVKINPRKTYESFNARFSKMTGAPA